jgi:hypothetical protein
VPRGQGSQVQLSRLSLGQTGRHVIVDWLDREITYEKINNITHTKNKVANEFGRILDTKQLKSKPNHCRVIR